MRFRTSIPTALGSIVKVTNASATVTLTRQYDTWGNLEVGATEPGYAFTGREWDPEIGLYYYRARYYDSKFGRLISEDPLGFEADVNFYAYAQNDPVLLRDPFGLKANPPAPCPTPPATPLAWPGQCAQQAPSKKPLPLIGWLLKPLFPAKDPNAQAQRVINNNSPCPGKQLSTNMFPCNALYPGNAGRRNEWEQWFNKACSDIGGKPNVVQFAAPLQGPVYVGYCCNTCAGK